MQIAIERHANSRFIKFALVLPSIVVETGSPIRYARRSVADSDLHPRDIAEDLLKGGDRIFHQLEIKAFVGCV